MPIPFNPYDFWDNDDLQRCPFASFSSIAEERLNAHNWFQIEDRRVLLNRLDRYADKLKGIKKDDMDT